MAAKDAPLGQDLGKPTFTDSLDRQEAGAKWSIAKGEWPLLNGVLHGKELKADKHAAVLTLQVPNTDSAIRFSFRLEGTEGFHLSFNKAQGHLFRIILTGEGINISLDKDKKDPKSKAISLGSAKGPFKQGEWYTMLVRVVGDQVAVECDNGVQAKGQHATLKTAKPNYRFVMRGKSLLLDDITIWNLQP